MSKDFDPSKLNIDFSFDNDNKENILNKETNFNKKENPKDETTHNEVKKEESLSFEQEEKKETKVEENTQNENDILSNLGNSTQSNSGEDSIGVIENLKEEDNNTKEENPSIEIPKQEEKIIFNINIKSIDDIIDISIKNNYDLIGIDPKDDFVKIIFKKDGVLKEEHYIKYPAYSNILLSAKKISNLNLEEQKKEQSGEGKYNFGKKIIKLQTKTKPSDMGELLILKVSETTAKATQTKKQQKISIQTMFMFFAIIIFIILILGSVFLSFIVFNAKSVDDVSFFYNLGINLNDVNSFLSKATTFVFSVIVFIQTIFLIIFIFKLLLTKKEYKSKRIKYFILTFVFIISTFTSGSVWMSVDRAIKAMPNWQEMSFGNIQLFDNELLITQNFGRDTAIINDYSNLIGPLDIKFDLSYYQKEEERKGFNIQKYIWDFGGNEKIETLSPELIKSFNEKGTYNIKLTLEGIDRRFPDKITTKEVGDIPSISIGYMVDIKENILPNGGKTIVIDGSDLRRLGQLEWFTKDNLENPAFVGEIFRPSKIFFDEEFIGLRIKDLHDSKKNKEKIFIVSGTKVEIDGEIDYEVSIDNDLEYTFRIKDIQNNFGAGFIESFKWFVDNKEINKTADITNIEKSSEIKVVFSNYGNQTIRVLMTDSSGNSKEISKQINIPRRIGLTNNIEIFNNGEKLEKVEYNLTTNEYFIYDIKAPSNIKLDTTKIRSDNISYVLKEVRWDIGNNGNYENIGDREINYAIDIPGENTIKIRYTFKHRRDDSDIVTLEEYIHLSSIEAPYILDLQIKPESEYVPTIVSFDASLSRVKDDDIVKYIYDYGDGVVEERDAINSGRRYTKEGNYTIKMTVVTKSGKEYSIEKPLILKPATTNAKITTSLKTAPVGQEINFLSTQSSGTIVGYYWDFGDGNFSTQANPNHAFSKTGTYRVKLEITLANNNIHTDYIDITITD